MKPEQWQQAREVLADALELKPEERPAFLDRVCSSDNSLRREVERLLASSGEAKSSFLESSALRVTLMPGAKLGEYEVQKLIGSGGMGEVYRARDTRLGRDVAIKVLPSFLSQDPDRLRRFEQEARAAAALNHPNILAVFQMGTYEGAPYLVSELLEGGTLREQLVRGPMPLRKAIDCGVQIARGLAAADGKGLIHRDLKPENIFVTKGELVKILDFGLAKLVRTEPDASTVANATQLGMVLGTIGYMSPEQARGEGGDHRSDIFAFGAVLYEMLSGKRAFQKPTSAETMSAILNEDPQPISQNAISLPPALQRVVHRCLEKIPEQRFQSASDLAFALEALSDAGSTSSRPISPEVSRVHWKWIVISAAAVLTIIGTAAWQLMPKLEPRVLGSTQLTNGSNPWVIVTDGSRLYFTDTRQTGSVLAQMSVNGGDVSIIPTLIKKPALTDISPDHSQLLVGTNDPGDVPIWSQPLPSGSPRRIGDLEVSWAAWSPDGGQLVFTTGHDLYIANADGSSRRKLCSQPDGYPDLARFSPDGTRIRFSLRTGTETGRLWEVRTTGSNLHPLLPGWRNSAAECCGQWTPDGRYYVFSSRLNSGAIDIFALRESMGLFRKNSTEPMRLTFGPLKFSQPVVSPDEKKMFVNGWQQRGELVRYDNLSKQFLPFLGGISAEHVSFSRDGKWVTYVSTPDGFLWRSRVDGSERLQLTFGPGFSALPRWAPDGKSIAFTSPQGGKPKLYVIAADGGSPKLLLPETASGSDPNWSNDGSQLVFGTGYPGEATESTIGIVDVRTGKFSTIPGSSGIFSPRWSPDGRYLAALSFGVTAKKLLLYDFQAQNWKTWATEDSGIAYPAWSADGHYLQYEAGGDIRRVKLGDSKSETLFSLKDFHIYNGLMGLWISTAPDNSVILVRDVSSQEIYALDVKWP